MHNKFGRHEGIGHGQNRQPCSPNIYTWLPDMSSWWSSNAPRDCQEGGDSVHVCVWFPWRFDLFVCVSPVTLVVQVALSGSTSRFSRCITATGQREANLATIRNVSIYTHTHTNPHIHTCGPRQMPTNTGDR